ncbi:MAG: DUF2096 family protein [Candidatus Bathyarchaeia archaeon]
MGVRALLRVKKGSVVIHAEKEELIERTWLLLADMAVDLRRMGAHVEPEVKTILRNSRVLIRQYKSQKPSTAREETLYQITQSIRILEGILFKTAKDEFGREYVATWRARLGGLDKYEEFQYYCGHPLYRDLVDELYEMPGGQKMRRCVQCGTCSSSCPAGFAMDYTPRKLVALIRAGAVDKVLASNTFWLCSSCYLCAVRCPAGIKFTEIMYRLRQLSGKLGLNGVGTPAKTLAKMFVDIVNRKGRVSEIELSMKFFLTTSPRRLLGMACLGLKLLVRGRLLHLPCKIKGLREIKQITSQASWRSDI